MPVSCKLVNLRITYDLLLQCLSSIYYHKSNKYKMLFIVIPFLDASIQFLYARSVARPDHKDFGNLLIMPRYWLHFVNRYLNFRGPEVAALARICGFHFSLPTTSKNSLEYLDSEQPFYVVDFPSDDFVKNLLSRSILLRYACEMWACASTYDELLNVLKEKLNLYELYMKPDRTFRIKVESFGKLITQSYKVQRIEDVLREIPFEGRLDLSNAEITFQIFEYYGPTRNSCQPNDPPLAVYFGRLIGQGQGHVPETYSVKTRFCIGNTTMDAMLSFLMANVAAIRPGSIVCDPFVGTGSLLLPAAHFGAYCIGTEINYKLLHGLGKSSRAFAGPRKPGENIIGNFKQYGLEGRLLGACLADASRHDLWRRKSVFDAIITDPPYGIREKSTRVGTKPGKTAQKVSEKYPNEHYPMKTKYSAGDVFLDLLNFAADYLVVNGRLVYWLPVLYHIYSDEVIPRHPRLRLLANCEQRLNAKYGRRLIVMEKMSEANDIEEGDDEFDGKAYFVRDCYTEIPLREFVTGTQDNGTLREGSSE